MAQRKRETFVYEGLGFPIQLINVPMRKVLGKWAIDINFAQLQRFVLLQLAKQVMPLSGKEITFIRHYFKMSTHAFAKLLDVSHVSILNWESEKRNMNANTEIVLRLRILDHLKVTDKEFRKTYHIYASNIISRAHDEEAESTPLEIDLEKIAC